MTKQNNWGNMNFTQIMMQQAQQSLDSPVYCRFCGKNLKEPSKESRQNNTGENTGNYTNDWEMRNSSHITCYEKTYYGGRR